METLMKKIGCLVLLAGFALTPVLRSCPSCSGSVPWTDGTDGSEESLAYNNSIYFMLGTPTALVFGLAFAWRLRQQNR